MKRLLTQRYVQIVLLLLLLCAAVLLRMQSPPAIERLRQITFDYYNKILPRKPAQDVVIVDIDEDSIRQFGQWPWPRQVVGELPVQLRAMGAKAVAFDIVFSEPDRTSPALMAKNLPETPDMQAVISTLSGLPDNDSLMTEKIAMAGNVITGFVAANQKTDQVPVLKAQFLNDGQFADPKSFVMAFKDFTSTLPSLSNAAAGNGSFTMVPENDGVVRRVPLLVGGIKDDKVADIYPALSLETLRVALDTPFFRVTSFGRNSTQGYGIRNIKVGQYSIPTDETGSLWVYYAGHRPNMYIPAWKVLSHQIDPALIKDKIVLVGTSAIGLLDLRSSPLDPVLPGVEVHAEIIEQILHRQFLQRPDFLNGAELLATVLISLFIIFVAPFVGTGMLALLGGVLIAGGGLGGLYIYQVHGYLLDPVYPSLAIVTIFIVSSVLTNLRTEMEKRAVRQAFSHYISPVLMEELAANPDKLKLGGEVRDISVMFTDIRNFTTISEGMDPADLIRMMNDFLTPMTSCVLDNRGTVDKYMGDAMMAFWNAPLDDADHARNACKAALGMVAALAPVNAQVKENAEKSGRPFRELKAGIGINSGRASVGNMGSKQRFAYSALGDTVNLASRLEGQTKGYGISIMISEATRKEAPDYAAIEIDLLTVKGRTEPERVYALLGDAEKARDQTFIDFSSVHHDMLALYRDQQWQAAAAACEKCRALRPDLSGLYDLYLSRMEIFKQTPPAKDWGGVWVAKDK